MLENSNNPKNSVLVFDLFFEIAVTAGLRVFPGHEELLALQDEAKLRCHNSGFQAICDGRAFDSRPMFS
jgi:hypothetical protein